MNLKHFFLQEFHSLPTEGHACIAKTFYGSRTMFVGKICEGCRRFFFFLYNLSANKVCTSASLWFVATNSSTLSLLGCESTCTSRTGVISVVVDRFSKVAHFGTLSTHFWACKADELFTHMIRKLHGYPPQHFSDRDPIFICKFWKTLFNLNGTELGVSMAYHPETDRQI